MNRVKIKYMLLPLIVTLSLFTGCTVKYVAEYDASAKEEVIQIAKKVDLFWGNLLDTPTDARQYAVFKDQYNVIETDIRGMQIKNEIREMNEISTNQIKILLELWVEDRETHKADDTFTDFIAKRHRTQFVRVFTAIAKGEAAKNMSSGTE